MNRNTYDAAVKTTAIVLLLLLSSGIVFAAPTVRGPLFSWTGTGVNDDDELFIGTEADGVPYLRSCSIISSAGSVQVLTSMNGSTWATAPLSLVDDGATDNNPVISTVALRQYTFFLVAAAFKVVQNGATAATATVNCEKR